MVSVLSFDWTLFDFLSFTLLGLLLTSLGNPLVGTKLFFDSSIILSNVSLYLAGYLYVNTGISESGPSTIPYS